MVSRTGGGFNKDVPLTNGAVINAIAVSPLGGAITPQLPMKLTLTALGTKPVDLKEILHRKTHETYEAIPRRA